jgi:PAS domain S-box-containing protein
MFNFNKQFEKTYGYSHEEIPSLEDWWLLAYPDSDYRKYVIDMCFAEIERAVETNTDTRPLEYNVTCKNGDVRTAVVSGSFIGDDMLLTFFDITERKQAEQERLANIHFLDSMDRINRAIQGTNDLEQMMSDVLDEVISIFNCDRAFLINFSGPDLETWTMPIARWRPEFPATYSKKTIPLDSLGKKVVKAMFDSNEPVKAGPATPFPLTEYVNESFGFKSFMGMALYPKTESLWELGIHQCSHERIFTTEEEILFKEIAVQLTDALTNLLMYRTLKKTEEKYRLIAEVTSDYIYSAKIFSDYSSSLDWVSGAFTNVTGYDVDEINSLSKGWLSVIHPEDIKKISEEEAFPLKSRTSGWEYEYRITTKLGEIRWVYDRIIRIQEQENEDIQVYGGVKDITERKIKEEKLHFQAMLLDAVEQAVIVTDHEGRVTYCNPITEKLYGWKPEEAIGQNVFEITVPDISKDQATEIMNTLARGESWSGDFLVQHKDGSVFPAHVTDTPFYNENGTLKGVIGISMDISDKKKTEDNLIKNNQFINNILKTVPSHVYIYDFEQNSNSYSSAYVENYLGYSAKEIQQLGSSALQTLIHPEDESKLYDMIHRLKDSNKNSIQKAEYRFKHKNGNWVWVLDRAIPFERNANGDVVKILGASINITKQKQIELSLKDSEERLRLAMQFANDGLFDWNLVTNEIYYSPVWKRLLGYEDDELPNDFSVWEKLTHSEDVKRSWKMQNELIKKSETSLK